MAYYTSFGHDLAWGLCRVVLIRNGRTCNVLIAIIIIHITIGASLGVKCAGVCGELNVNIHKLIKYDAVVCLHT